MDLADRLEALVSKLETSGVRVSGASLIRAHHNHVIQWRAVLALTYNLGLDVGGKELNGYGDTGSDAITAVEKETNTFLEHWTQRRNSRPTGA
jgi:hypothetical protein